MSEVGAHNPGGMPPGKGPRRLKKYSIDQTIGALKTNSATVMIIKHIAYITCLLSNDAWHAYGVMVVYDIHHGAGRITYFAESAILFLADTLMGEVVARSN